MSRLVDSQPAAELSTVVPSVHVATQGERAIKTLSHGTLVWQPHGCVVCMCVYSMTSCFPHCGRGNHTTFNHLLSAWILIMLISLFLHPFFVLSLPPSPPLPPPFLVHVSLILFFLGTFLPVYFAVFCLYLVDLGTCTLILTTSWPLQISFRYPFLPQSTIFKVILLDMLCLSILLNHEYGVTALSSSSFWYDL